MTKTIYWLNLKAEYLLGATPKELAKKYNLTSKQVRDKANRENWANEKATIRDKTRQNLQNKIDGLLNKVLDVLSEVMNNPLAENKDKVAAARAILDVSGLKRLTQEIKTDVTAEVKAPKWDKKMAKQVMKEKDFTYTKLD